MKVAIVHYWFITRRGGEKVVESLLKIYPNADIYTLFYDREKYGTFLDKQKVYTSKLDTPFLRKHYQKIFPLYPYGIKSLKLKDKYDLIISSESGPAKGIKIEDNTPHVCYIHTPLRYCYSHKKMYLDAIPQGLRTLANLFLNRLMNWDKKTVDNVDLYISNSKNTAKRVEKYYQKESKIIYPPIDDNLFEPKKGLIMKKEYYLSFGAITPYKKIDILVDAFARTDKKLVVIGDGSEKTKLLKKAGKNIIFTGVKPWKEIDQVLKKTKALLFPGEEDFGLIPLEVMSYGIPVIAYKKGGALETVIENKENLAKATGVFFSEQNAESVVDAMNYFESISHMFDPNFIRHHAAKFKESVFIEKFESTVTTFLKDH